MLDDNDSFSDVQKKILDVFWITMRPFSSVHGHHSQVAIYNNQVEIKRIEKLRENKDVELQVIFKGHFS